MQNTRNQSKFFSLIVGLMIFAGTVSLHAQDFGDLDQKSYYTKIFNRNELKDLASAKKDFLKGRKKDKKAEAHFRKANAYEKIAEQETVIPRKISRLKKKADRQRRRGRRDGFKALDKFLPANKIIFAIYQKKLGNQVLSDPVIKRKADTLKRLANIEFARGNKILAEAKAYDEQRKYRMYLKADSLQYAAIKKQELAFGIIYNDPHAVYELPGEKQEDTDETADNDNDSDKNNEQNDKPEQDNNKAENNNTTDDKNDYEPGDDEQLYKFKYDIILPKLSLTDNEKKSIENAEKTDNEADASLKASEPAFAEIEQLKTEIRNTNDEDKKKELRTKINEKQILLYADLNRAARKRIKAMSNRYHIYKNHLEEAKPKTDPNLIKLAEKYIKNSRRYYQDSKDALGSATFQVYKSDEYLVLMEALQLINYAVQEQENAYSVYFGFNTVPLPDDSVTAETNEQEDSDKTADNELTGDKSDNENKTDPESEKSKEKTSKYNYLGSYVYTLAQPEPRPLVHKEGIVFKIQAGVFKNLLPIEKYQEFEPVSYDVFKNNPYQRFMFGEFRSIEFVENKLKEVREAGFSDAYIVAYVDGKRTSYKKVKEIIEQRELVPESTDNTTADKSDTKYVLPELNYGTGEYDFAEGSDITKTKGLKYTIQFGMYRMPKTNREIKNIAPLAREVTDEGIRYLKGPFDTYEEARNELKEVHDKGFPEAFITAYNNGKYIKVHKAKSIQKNSRKAEEDKSPEVYFAVQLGAFSRELNPDEKKRFDEIAKTRTIHTHKTTDGLTVYTVGKYASYTQVSEAKNKLRKAGYEGVFPVAFKNKKKISVKQALELLK